MRRGSIISGTAGWPIRRTGGSGLRLPPDVLDITAHNGDALVLEVVQVSRTVCLVGDQTSLGQQLEMAGYSGAADWQRVGYLLDGAWATRQQLDDGPPLGVAAGMEGSASGAGGDT